MPFKKLAIISAFFMTTTAANADINQGLVGYWNFDDCTATNKAGVADNGVINGSPKCVQSISGTGFLFNGTTDYIQIPNTQSLNPEQITISAWVNPTYLSRSLGSNIIINKENQYEIGIVGAPSGENEGELRDLVFALNPDWDWFSANHYKPKMNKFFHVALTFNNLTNLAVIYVNGKASGSVVYASSIKNTTNCLRIGARGCGNGAGTAVGFFSGIIDEVRIYNRTLTASEIQDLYYENNTPTIKGTAPWVTQHSITCENITQGTKVTIPRTKAAVWDCEKSGLSVNSGDKVKVTIEGTRF